MIMVNKRKYKGGKFRFQMKSQSKMNFIHFSKEVDFSQVKFLTNS
jgi:hypothetical protein